MIEDSILEYSVVGIWRDVGGERFRNGFGSHFVDFPWFWKDFDSWKSRVHETPSRTIQSHPQKSKIASKRPSLEDAPFLFPSTVGPQCIGLPDAVLADGAFSKLH